MITRQQVERAAPDSNEYPESSEDRLRVVVADGDGLARRMMHDALHETDRIAIVLTARDAREALELALYYRPTVVLVDTALPHGGALGTVRTLVRSLPAARILTVSATPEEDETALTALKAGASGHIDKDVEPAELARLVDLAIDGEAIVPRRLVGPMLGLLHEAPNAGWRPLHSRLTTREWQIVEMLAEPASTELMAERLVLSQTTVYTHVKNLMRKLSVHSRSDAVIAAQRLRHDEALMRKIPIEPSSTSSPTVNGAGNP